MLEELDALLGEAVGFLSAGKSSGATAINLTSARYKGTVYYKDKWYTADIEPYSSRKLTEYSVPQNRRCHMTMNISKAICSVLPSTKTAI